MPDPVARYWAVLPAGGSGSRMGAAMPKQYLELAGLTLLERSVRAVLRAPWIVQAVVVAAPGDLRAEAVVSSIDRARVINQGGETRRDSVLAGLRFLLEGCGADAHDWALVHDAARPGLEIEALERLRAELLGSDFGGLLAMPVADTVKRVNPGGNTVAQTIDRQELWLAQTPQMFRLGPLVAALERHAGVTDEAAAIEAEGAPVRLVLGGRRNFKITTPDDLEMMRKLLELDR